MLLRSRRNLYGFMWVAAILGAILNAHTAHAEKVNPAICISSNETDPRVLTVEYSGEALVPCRTYYRKWDVRTEIGAALHTSGYCEALVDQVVENLAGEGFLCRRVDPEEDIEALYQQYR